ncbi:hypothetical protein GW17_00028272 [Ensete ventricosum]|nr:hypothetical protein GW17_00028272 [Ensete ventricosum]
MGVATCMQGPCRGGHPRSGHLQAGPLQGRPPMVRPPAGAAARGQAIGVAPTVSLQGGDAHKGAAYGHDTTGMPPVGIGNTHRDDANGGVVPEPAREAPAGIAYVGAATAN